MMLKEDMYCVSIYDILLAVLEVLDPVPARISQLG